MTEADTLKESTLTKLAAREINGTQAAEILQLSVRQVKKLKRRFAKKGIKKHKEGFTHFYRISKNTL